LVSDLGPEQGHTQVGADRLAGSALWRGMLGLLDRAGDALAVFSGEDDRLQYVNQAFIHLLGVDAVGLPARDAFARYPEWAPLLEQTRHSPAGIDLPDVPLVRRHGDVERRVVAQLSFVPLPNDDGSVWGVACIGRDVTANRLANERARHVALVTRIATDLSRSLDLQETANVLTGLAANLLGGWSVLDLWLPDGSLQRVAGSHQEPHMQPVLEAFMRFPRVSGRIARTPQEESVAHRVARTGHPAAGRFDSGALAAAALDPRHAELIRRLGTGPYLIVPLWVGARRLGALSLLRADSQQGFSSRDRALAGELAERGALALAHAADYEDQRRAALTFQRALMPAALVGTEGIELAARYYAAVRGVEVGGDWYDTLALPDGSMVLVIGDVEGHDVQATAVMGQVRSAVRAYAQEGHPPGSVIQRANRFLMEAGSERLVTLLYLQVFPAERLIIGVSAGHPPAVVQSPEAGARRLQLPPGLPLGIDLASTWSEHTVTLAPGTTLAMFTDGLVEVPGEGVDPGIDRIIALLDELGTSGAGPRPGPAPTSASASTSTAASASTSASTSAGASAGPDQRGRNATAVRLPPVSDIADELVRGALRGSEHHDDVALLVARLSAADARPAANQANRRLPASPTSCPIARHFVRDVLRQWGIDAEVRHTAELLVSELVTNAARHSEDSVELRLQEIGHRLRLEVSDESHRLPVLRAPTPLDTAGRGLHLIARLSSRWGTSLEAGGKAVWCELDLDQPET
jgi:anti-sigma regulatory factor (Ser/Thr protein kinase)/GAF domain-containing protein